MAPGDEPMVQENRKDVQTEVEHWNDVERRTSHGQRLFWLNHPRVADHYYRKALVDGLQWREWLVRQWGGAGDIAVELGCGSSAALMDLVNAGVVRKGIGYDLDDSRFGRAPTAGGSTTFVAADINRIALDENRYDLIYALQSFHHFEALEHIMGEASAALTDRGFFVLDEFVGPRRFQWTDKQLAITADLLGLIPKRLRTYANGTEKRAEGRSTPEEVIRVCPSEAIRSDEIVRIFYEHFDVVAHHNLGGTIQHLLYSGIIQNFPDDSEEIDHLIDCVNAIETMMIDNGLLQSDFALLIGKKRAAR